MVQVSVTAAGPCVQLKRQFHFFVNINVRIDTTFMSLLNRESTTIGQL